MHIKYSTVQVTYKQNHRKTIRTAEDNPQLQVYSLCQENNNDTNKITGQLKWHLNINKKMQGGR